MKKLHWKISLVLLTFFLLVPYAGEFGNLKVKADETGQTQTSNSSSEPANTVESSQPASTEQSQSSTEQAPAPSQTPQSSSAQEQTKTSTTSQQSQSGTLSGMIDQMFPPQLPAPTKAKPSATIEYVNGGVKFNNKFYTEAEFAKYIEKNFVPNPQVQFHVDASGKIVIDSQTRIASTMNWPEIGGAAAKGATAIGSLGGATILASAGAALLIGGGLTVGYDLLFPHKVGGDIKATPAMIAAMAKNSGRFAKKQAERKAAGKNEHRKVGGPAQKQTHQNANRNKVDKKKTNPTWKSRK
ncbi:hypothetical protein [Lactococcus cremoris]|uniref:Uncharacterized protein n=1 Tax=Lactococcus cremoris subsp. tructae TaxID=542833 RepID=A0A2A5SQR7_LACLC|nr:hypothetical protein [Lactococcus cremoris]PCS16738.1 hypothetical protein RU92_GL000908 [Lactococcus cremoris subsp. tructae]